MSREVHVRFCERPEVKFLRPTHPNGFDRATYRQRVTHFTEELPFLSEEDKDWIMGRAIVARLDWS
jgi:hypothetical protein